MPVALSERDAFSYDKFTLTSGQATDSPGNRTFTLTKSIFLPELPETLEVLINSVKLKGDGTATAAGSGDEFYVNSAPAPTTMTIEPNAVLAAQTDSAVTSLATSDILVIRRISNRTTKNIDYAPGSVIREADLDNSNTQIIHIAQEAVDIALQGIILDADNKYNANDGTADRIIKNLEDGAAANDAVNFSQLTATEVATLAYKEDTEDYKLETADWATKVNGVVNTYTDNVAQSDGTDQSAKAYAIGGTGVTTTASKGAAKEWATTTGGAVDTSEFSAKAYAIGGTGVTTSSGKGASKEWATTTGGAVDTSEYSAKEYAVGTTATSSKTYATKVDGAVTGTDFSSKAWAVGGTNVTTTASRGAAKEWATSTGAAVDTSEYSAKEYAIGTTVAAGSAKDWAILAEDSVVDGGSGYSALHWAAKASNSQVAAKASAAAVASTFDSFDDTYLGTMADGATATDADTTGTWAINSSVITVASATNIVVGQEVTGAGIPTDANVIAVAGTSITISENMDAAGSGVDLDFRGQGVYGAFNGTKDGPATDNDGGALANGMLYFNTTDNSMKVYKETGAAWIKTSASGGVSLVMHKAVASGSETSFAAGTFTPTLSYEVNNIVVWLNGVKLDSTDFTATTGTSITGLAALAASDELVVLAFKTFEVGDAVSAASGGTFGGAVTCAAGLVANTADINAGTFDGIVGGTTPAAGTFTTCDATTDFTIGGTVITNNTITDDGTLTITATTGITLGQDTALSAGKSLETSTTGKVKQKGAFMQSSTHQALTLGY